MFYLCRARELTGDACKDIDEEIKLKLQCYLIELQSGGNIKLTQIDVNDDCFKACSHLVQSSFLIADMQNAEFEMLYGVKITGMQVLEVTHMENRLLMNRYNINQRNYRWLIPCIHYCRLH